MAFPLTQETTYVATSSQVKAADLNNLQGGFVTAQHGSVPETVPGTDGVALAGSPVGITGYWVAAAGSDSVRFVLKLRPGTKITKIEAFVDQVGATPMTFNLRPLTNAGFGAITDTEAGNATTGPKTLPKTVAVTTAVSTAYALTWISGQANDILYFFEVTIEKTS